MCECVFKQVAYMWVLNVNLVTALILISNTYVHTRERFVFLLPIFILIR
jgi:hypothetical protein